VTPRELEEKKLKNQQIYFRSRNHHDMKEQWQIAYGEVRPTSVDMIDVSRQRPPKWAALCSGALSLVLIVLLANGSSTVLIRLVSAFAIFDI
jgi:hypothetical protein